MSAMLGTSWLEAKAPNNLHNGRDDVLHVRKSIRIIAGCKGANLYVELIITTRATVLLR